MRSLAVCFPRTRLQSFVSYAMVCALCARLPIRWPESILALFRALETIAQSQEVFSVRLLSRKWT